MNFQRLISVISVMPVCAAGAINLRRRGLLPTAALFVLAAAGQAEWINRFATAGDVSGNRAFFNIVTGFPSECPIIEIVNDSGFPAIIRTVRFINGRYIGQGNPNLDDWHLTLRKSLNDVLGMTEWSSNAQAYPIGPPSQWSNFPGAVDSAGNPVQETVLTGLERLKIVIPARSVRFLGLANLAPVENGFTFTLMTDWRLPEADYGFMSTGEPPVKTISEITNDLFTNMAINVEVRLQRPVIRR
ncbi:MAG: hypothetical protein H0W86_04880 [Armatimonadetes bacterium]|nr:hypothetical protein [Armatimonadota bacterium]